MLQKTIADNIVKLLILSHVKTRTVHIYATILFHSAPGAK